PQTIDFTALFPIQDPIAPSPLLYNKYLMQKIGTGEQRITILWSKNLSYPEGFTETLSNPVKNFCSLKVRRAHLTSRKLRMVSVGEEDS
ncbi:MAG TPA: hypothetical protein DDW51_06300, partial [Cyanobacteria bacterium UBA11367]|nr:hypothetical protein [Cyanobacteria bacterium UBA11367]HBS70809.1 hypothetical protein [Cyanobacteria bacterium UBA11153]